MGSTLLLLEILLAHHTAVAEPTTGETYELKRYSLLLPFWGASSPAEGEMNDYGMLQLHMNQQHPLDLLYLNYISDYVF